MKKKDERKSKHVSFDGVADHHWPTEARSPQFPGWLGGSAYCEVPGERFRERKLRNRLYG